MGWIKSILAFLGLIPKAVDAGEDAKAKRDLDESGRIRAEAEADARKPQ